MRAMLRNGITFAIFKFNEYVLATKRSITKYASLHNKTNIYEWKITAWDIVCHKMTVTRNSLYLVRVTYIFFWHGMCSFNFLFPSISLYLITVTMFVSLSRTWVKSSFSRAVCLLTQKSHNKFHKKIRKENDSHRIFFLFMPSVSSYDIQRTKIRKICQNLFDLCHLFPYVFIWNDHYKKYDIDEFCDLHYNQFIWKICRYIEALSIEYLYHHMKCNEIFALFLLYVNDI